MAENSQNQYFPDEVTLPGETLAETLKAKSMTQAEFSLRSGLSEKTISQIINGKAPITHESALAFERVLGASAQFWMNRETRYREYLARIEEKEHLSSLTSWASYFPYAEMAKRHYVEPIPHTQKEARVSSLLDFFAVVSPSAWSDVWEKREVAFRRSAKVCDNLHVVASWLRAGERRAYDLSAEDYSASQFRAVIPSLRALTNSPIPDAAPEMESLCASAGVRLALVPELPKLGASGATYWLRDSKPVIQLSLRYKTTDHFWFSFFHEAKHVFQESRKKVFLDTPAFDLDAPEEEEANKFSGDTLIPPVAYASFVSSHSRFTAAIIRSFAQELEIHPGIVVGRLQHDRKIPFKNHNGLKQRVTWKA